MRIYIENYQPSKITSIILSKNIEPFFRKKNSVCEIYSPEGIYILQNNKTYKMSCEKGKKPRKVLNYFDENSKYKNIIIDYSLVKNDTQYYHIPLEHVCCKTETFIYSRSEKSQVELLVKGFYQKKEIELNKKETNHYLNTDKYLNLVVTDFYFNIKDDLELNDINLRDDLEFFYNLLE